MPTPATTTKRSEAMVSGSASTLQRGTSMMVRVVGILAVMALSACGVGVEGEDPEGAAATRSELQLACAELGTCPQAPVPGPSATGAVVSAQVPGTVALPQDPIPWRPLTSTRPFAPNSPETGVPHR
jgi:hypothetical protein